MKKVLTRLLVILLVLSSFSIHALADGPAFQVSNVQAAPGEEATVTVSTVNNPGIASFWFTIEYDSAVLTWTDVKPADLGGLWDVQVGESALWVSADNYTGDAVLLTLTFRVSDTAPSGKTAVSVSYEPDNVFDEEENNVSFDIIPGGVEVISGQTAESGSVQADTPAAGENAVDAATPTEKEHDTAPAAVTTPAVSTMASPARQTEEETAELPDSSADRVADSEAETPVPAAESSPVGLGKATAGAEASPAAAVAPTEGTNDVFPEQAHNTQTALWIWILGAAVVAGAVAALIVMKKRRQRES